MNSLTFIAPSGSPASGTILEQLNPPGSTSGANHLGFFGAGGPQGIPFAVIVNSYQDRTFITNVNGANLGVAPFGLLGSGELLNHKYLTSSTVNVDGNGGVSLTSVPSESGTLLVRLEASGALSVETQNAIFRAVDLNASSGINDLNSIPANLTIQAYELQEDSVWTQIAGNGAVDNRLFLTDHSFSSPIHDFFIGISASPEQVGVRTNVGYYFVVEFL